MYDEIDDMTPEAYAAMWGCDPVYDKLPNQSGDGYQFYNFTVVSGWDIEQRLDFYALFLPAIERTIQSVQQRPDCFEPHDEADLLKLQQHVRALDTFAFYEYKRAADDADLVRMRKLRTKNLG